MALTPYYWQTVIEAFIESIPDYKNVWESSMYNLAIDRLSNRDVSQTRYGIRVALRFDLGDNRVEATAYWPEKKRCLCFSKKARGVCSHELAVKLFLFEQDYASKQRDTELYNTLQAQGVA